MRTDSFSGGRNSGTVHIVGHSVRRRFEGADVVVGVGDELFSLLALSGLSSFHLILH